MNDRNIVKNLFNAEINKKYFSRHSSSSYTFSLKDYRRTYCGY